MPHILHLGATVLCVHGGQATPTMTDPRVKVSGQPIVKQPSPHAVAGCPFVAGLVPMPCVTANWVTAAVRVKAGGMPVLLKNSQAVCVPNGTGVNIVATQVRVKAT